MELVKAKQQVSTLRLRESLVPTSMNQSTRCNWLVAAIVAGVVSIGCWLCVPATGEEGSKNWQHIQEAGNATAPSVKWLGNGGTNVLLPFVPMGEVDRDTETTTAVRDALKNGDVVRAEQILANAQQSQPAVPSDSQPIQRLSPELRAEVLRDEVEFYRICLYDCCDPDGDTVDVLIDGKVYARVTLTTNGTVLSIPFSTSRPPSIEIRGYYDGGGGITVGCRTSQGSAFLRRLWIGETTPLTFANR